MNNQNADSLRAGRIAGRGSVEGDGTHACPPGFPVKGNASSKLAHLPGGRWYDATIPEVCFKTPEDAEDAGYRVTGNASERTWARGDGSHSCPEGFPIKGNLSSMIAHPPESRYFDATIPDVCFASAEAALAQGYRISGGSNATHPAETQGVANGGKPAAPTVADRTAESAQTASTEIQASGQRADDGTKIDRGSNQTIPTSADAAKDDAPPSALLAADTSALAEADAAPSAAISSDASAAGTTDDARSTASPPPDATDVPQSMAPSSAAVNKQDAEDHVNDASSTDRDASASLRSTSAESTAVEVPVASPAPDIATAPPTVAPSTAPTNPIESSQTQTAPPQPPLNQPVQAPTSQFMTSNAPLSTTAASSAQAESKRRSIRHEGSLDCPTDLPIKGIERTRRAVGPTDAGYNATMPDICFETMSDAIEDGYRAISDPAVFRVTAAVPQNEPEPGTTLVIRIRRWWVKRKSTGG